MEKKDNQNVQNHKKDNSPSHPGKLFLYYLCHYEWMNKPINCSSCQFIHLSVCVYLFHVCAFVGEKQYSDVWLLLWNVCNKIWSVGLILMTADKGPTTSKLHIQGKRLYLWYSRGKNQLINPDYELPTIPFPVLMK